MTVLKVSNVQGITIRDEWGAYHEVLFLMEHETTIPNLKDLSFQYGYYSVYKVNTTTYFSIFSEQK